VRSTLPNCKRNSNKRRTFKVRELEKCRLSQSDCTAMPTATLLLIPFFAIMQKTSHRCNPTRTPRSLQTLPASKATRTAKKCNAIPPALDFSVLPAGPKPSPPHDLTNPAPPQSSLFHHRTPLTCSTKNSLLFPRGLGYRSTPLRPWGV
jgi:hypothetical protein